MAEAVAEEIRRTMRTAAPLVIVLALALGAAALRTAAEDRSTRREAGPATAPVEARFRAEVGPFLETYCLGCHGKPKPKGDLDLSASTTAESVAKDLSH